MSSFKTLLISLIVMFVLVSCSVTLIYYGLMRASGKADEAKEMIIGTVSSAVPDNIKSVSEKVKSSALRLSDTVVTTYNKHLRIYKSEYPAQRT